MTGRKKTRIIAGVIKYNIERDIGDGKNAEEILNMYIGMFPVPWHDAVSNVIDTDYPEYKEYWQKLLLLQ